MLWGNIVGEYWCVMREYCGRLVGMRKEPFRESKAADEGEERGIHTQHYSCHQSDDKIKHSLSGWDIFVIVKKILFTKRNISSNISKNLSLDKTWKPQYMFSIFFSRILSLQYAHNYFVKFLSHCWEEKLCYILYLLWPPFSVAPTRTFINAFENQGMGLESQTVHW